jgi:hypothetical protein
MSKPMYRLYSRKPDGTVEKRNVLCGAPSKDHVLTKYDRMEPDNVFWFEEEIVEMDNTKPAFVRKGR